MSQVKKEAQKGYRTDGASPVAGMQCWDANRYSSAALSDLLNLMPQMKVVTQNNHLGDYAYLRDVRITNYFRHICLGIFLRASLHKNLIPLLYTYAKFWIDLFLQGFKTGHLTAGQPHMPENKLGQSQFS